MLRIHPTSSLRHCFLMRLDECVCGLEQATRHEGLYASKFPYSCVSKWAKGRIGATTKPKRPLCVPPTAFAGGSALVFYNSTTYYDDLLWAAAWMYRATSNASYLQVCLSPHVSIEPP
jgi:hypothetical protein